MSATKSRVKERSNSKTASSPIPCDPARSPQAQYHIDCGLSEHKQGRLYEALSQYQRALDVDGEDAYGRYLAGLALKGLGRESEATAEWCRATALFPLDEVSEWGLSMARKMLGDFA